MALAVWALMKSMNRHMSKVDFAESPAAKTEGSAEDAEATGPAKPRQG